MKAGPMIAFLLAFSLMAGLSAQTADGGRDAEADHIAYAVGPEDITIETSMMSVKISKSHPSIMVRHAGNSTEPGYGLVFSSVLAYNSTPADQLVLEDVAYRAPLEKTAWTLLGPTSQEDSDGGCAVVVSLEALVTMQKKLMSGGRNPDPGPTDSESITGWASISVTFTISTQNRSFSYGEIPGSSQFFVNGSTEVKLDIELRLHKTIQADRAALEMTIMQMEWGSFTQPSAVPYTLRGYEANGETVCNPAVNETNGTHETVHTFQHRNQLKQMFSFEHANESEAFFAWASQARLARTGSEGLEAVAAYYRTDGEALRIYLSTPVDESTEMIYHDPSIGVLPLSAGGEDGFVHLPEGTLIGESIFSLGVGVAIGVATAGGITVLIALRRPVSEDPTDLVVLEKNRYYKGKR